MKLLLDQGLPRTTVDLLIAAGFEAVHVGSLEMHAATDAEIIQAALAQDAIIVSLDSDFHTLLATSGASRPSVIRIRVEGLTAEPLAELLLKVLAEIDNELEIGAVASVNEHQIRVRSLPIGKKAR